MSWLIEKDFAFEAAHQLSNHPGKCKRLHGHSYGVAVRLRSEQLQEEGSEAGMIRDYSWIASVFLSRVHEALDHRFLNEIDGLENPTTEVVARWIFDRLAPQLPQLESVLVSESLTTRCEYRP